MTKLIIWKALCIQVVHFMKGQLIVPIAQPEKDYSDF